MELFPAIDLRSGRVVRLRHGDDGARTEYAADPLAVLESYRRAGARWVHVVDLDAAFGEPPQLELLTRMLSRPGRPRIQLGGGLRSAQAVERILALGADRAVLGSLVGRDFEAFAALTRRHPGRLVPALDVAGDAVRLEGWTATGAPWDSLARRLRGSPCPAVLVTDIGRDGTLEGANLDLALAVARASGLPALLSGGVAALGDLSAAARCPEIGGAVVGKALYEGAFSVAEALAAVGGGHEVFTELTARVIPCLDVAEGRVVKGIRFQDLVDVGDPATAARRYAEQGADEIVFLDVSASHEGRPARRDWIEQVASQVFVPLTVGGGVREVADARRLLLAGADKVGVNSAAVADPDLLSRLADRFGRQCVVLSVDARRVAAGPTEPPAWEVVTYGGRRATGLDALEWIEEGVARGAGEILLTSIDGDGTRSGYDLELLRAVTDRVAVPVIASGGAGSVDHLAAALEAGAAAVLAASIFHHGETTVAAVKAELARRGFAMREVA